MLTALITGAVKGPWFRLFDKVFAERNLLTAFQQVATGLCGTQLWISTRSQLPGRVASC
jgi:hypothetical protein